MNVSSALVLAAASLLGLAALQAVTFAVARRIGRYNVVDVVWGLGFVVVAALAALLGTAPVERRVLLLVLVAVWGLRLSLHMHRRTAGHGEDPRYTALLDRHGHSAGVVVRRIFLTQGLAQWVISLPLQVAAVTGPVSGVVRLLVVAGVLVWLIGFVFEAVGDRQLARFRADPRHRGTVMDRGLWAWTRHPNYFGDACVWWGLWLVAAAAWPGALTVFAPLLMTYVLVQGTGARLLEEHMAERPGYREYQRRTAYFFPRPPRRSRP
ncbi:DUF1295 domain-containing protein [Nocardia puris]|uniref:Steroid 5-alpha reductase family enzyme n=1 Tax=Nocardia puris TaxID=208602 RepID=A0A366DVS2_9NOCA|nr:DUF1295 domain-containing protein [Nocardia puris]MBF6210051.1 DUF1295 domain-containing protein [Nocardia puris]MBF6368242.1 DUF1295 domain-containing protein [Nocardia puris]MBF6458039.1 DUF1295 domain-containing protein [Nocardia puris]RBO94201.1 steroid 5-alpha reductase family enzyme [Nocardia puris]